MSGSAEVARLAPSCSHNQLLKEQVDLVLRKMIVLGELVPDEQLVEAQLVWSSMATSHARPGFWQHDVVKNSNDPQDQHMLDIQGAHLVLHEAIVQRNFEAATTAMLSHLQSAYARVIQELQLPQSEAEVSQ